VSGEVLALPQPDRFCIVQVSWASVANVGRIRTGRSLEIKKTIGRAYNNSKEFLASVRDENSISGNENAPHLLLYTGSQYELLLSSLNDAGTASTRANFASNQPAHRFNKFEILE
jgi:hypothetical protein